MNASSSAPSARAAGRIIPRTRRPGTRGRACRTGRRSPRAAAPLPAQPSSDGRGAPLVLEHAVDDEVVEALRDRAAGLLAQHGLLDEPQPLGDRAAADVPRGRPDDDPVEPQLVERDRHQREHGPRHEPAALPLAHVPVPDLARDAELVLVQADTHRERPVDVDAAARESFGFAVTVSSHVRWSSTERVCSVHGIHGSSRSRFASTAAYSSSASSTVCATEHGAVAEVEGQRAHGPRRRGLLPLLLLQHAAEDLADQRLGQRRRGTPTPSARGTR